MTQFRYFLALAVFVLFALTSTVGQTHFGNPVSQPVPPPPDRYSEPSGEPYEVRVPTDPIAPLPYHPGVQPLWPPPAQQSEFPSYDRLVKIVKDNGKPLLEIEDGGPFAVRGESIVLRFGKEHSCTLKVEKGQIRFQSKQFQGAADSIKTNGSLLILAGNASLTYQTGKSQGQISTQGIAIDLHSGRIIAEVHELQLVPATPARGDVLYPSARPFAPAY